MIAHRLRLVLVTALTAHATVACTKGPEFAPITNAPPGAVAELHQSLRSETQSVRITEGVALAVECKDGKGRPCSFSGTTSADPSIASVRRAYADLDQEVVSRDNGKQTSYLDRTVFVVVGKKPGTTALNVITGYGDVSMIVDVLPAGR